jgi:membrane protein implicated in regulation of membrane protease activity
VRTGAEGIVGYVGVVRNSAETTGNVALDGALWRARRSVIQDEELRVGDQVVVERSHRSHPCPVRRAEHWELP